MTDAPMTPEYERRIRSHVAEMSNYSLGNLFARDLLAEVDRLRKALSDAADQVADLEDELGKASAEAAALRQRLHEAAMARVWTNEDGKKFVFADDLKGPLLGKASVRDLRSGAAAARRMLRRPGACFTCGDVPDEWCPDCACCKAGCDGGRTNNPCTHANAPWKNRP
ncbi:hypothetical protein [Streptomyces globisporus]